MTRLERAREVGLFWRGHDLVARIAAEGIHLKGKRQRWSTGYLLPWAAAYDVAVKMRIAEKKAERAVQRKARRR